MFLAQLLRPYQEAIVSFYCVLRRALHQVQHTSAICLPDSMENENKLLLPPDCVRGMTKLDRDAFKKNVLVPYVEVDVHILKCALNILKPYMLKLLKFNAVQEVAENKLCKDVILNPVLVKSWESMKPTEVEALGKLDVSKELLWTSIEIGYENWKAEEILKAVLPSDVEGASSFSTVGHILHLNLREHLLDYRFLIGQVLLDKLPRASLVVNKLNIIESSFRNFKMEVVAGEGSTVTKLKENGSMYEFDFAEVYWNSRLSAEHERIVRKLKCGDVVFDMFAGVGPFAIPAAKKKCVVYANDLNPHSVTWLTHNVKLNKVSERVHICKLDGREFVKDVIKPRLEEIWAQNASGELVTNTSVHIVMNLPAIAIEFLDSFKGLLSGTSTSLEKAILPIVHCYTFVKDADWKEVGLKLVNDTLSINLMNDVDSTEVFYVRKVAPLKEMVRVSFVLPHDVLCCENADESTLAACAQGPPAKRLCYDDD